MDKYISARDKIFLCPRIRAWIRKVWTVVYSVLIHVLSWISPCRIRCWIAGISRITAADKPQDKYTYLQWKIE